MKQNMATLPRPLAFLSRHRVFGLLPQDERAALADQCSWACFAAGALVLAQGQLPDQLALIASGTVNIEDPDLGWTLQLQAGECFGAGVTPAQPRGGAGAGH